MAAYDEDLMRGLAQLGPDGALQTLRAIGRQLNARERGRTLSMGERQFLGAAVQIVVHRFPKISRKDIPP